MANEAMVPLQTDGRYANPWGVNNSKSLWSVLKWKMTSKSESWPAQVGFAPRVLPAAPTQGAVVTWINHASFLVQLPGLNILLDPVFSERASPFSWAGPKRVHAPGVSWETLPKIDLVLVSHNHYDHLDIKTLVKLAERDAPQFFVPTGDADLLKDKGIKSVSEFSWFQEQTVKDARIVFTPAQHWSARWTWDKNKSLWGGWWIQQGETKLFHAGDTGHGPHFKVIRERLGTPGLAMIPIGAYEPRWFMKDMHMNPSDAVLAFEDLGRPESVAMHFGTFQLTDEGILQPAQELKAALGAERAELFHIPQIGESFVTRPAP